MVLKMRFFLCTLIYISLIGLISIFLTITDKHRAIKGKWRVKESALLLFATLGGAMPMYFCMKTIRHKTQKAKFMVLLPLMFVAQIIVIVFTFRYLF